MSLHDDEHAERVSGDLSALRDYHNQIHLRLQRAVTGEPARGDSLLAFDELLNRVESLRQKASS